MPQLARYMWLVQLSSHGSFCCSQQLIYIYSFDHLHEIMYQVQLLQW